MIKELFLPSSDTAVALQVVGTAIAAPLVVLALVRRDKHDVAWLSAGVMSLWVAFLALRTLH